MVEDLFSTGSETKEQTSADAVSPVTYTIRGHVLRVVYASDDGQYVVIRMQTGSGQECTVVGAMQGVLDGQDIEATGNWENHKDHGRQFRVRTFRAVLPSSEEGLRRYLASGLIPGIGPKFAERIVAHFGEDTLEVLDKYSERLKDVPGIGKKRIAEIRSAWKKYSEQRDILVFLQGLGLSAAYCARIIDRYGVAAAEIVRRNPYQLASEIHGIGFLTADRIAANLGVKKDNPIRLASGVMYVLDQLSQNQGHVCYPREKLVEEAERVLGVGGEAIVIGFDRALASGHIVMENVQHPSPVSYVYHRRLHTAETELAEALLVQIRCPGHPVRVQERLLGSAWNMLNTAQKEAVHNAFLHNLSIITGGPGVGKTTVVGQIVSLARRLGYRVQLAAPTGRAAKRMGEAAGMEAKTIHRLLRWEPAERRFTHDPDNPLKCDMLVVDEVSMLDVTLANSLFRAVRPGTKVVLVGDRDQLPSVGPGVVLQDLISCGRLPVTQLTEIYRQSENSRIVTNAHEVNRGRMPDLRSVPSQIKADFYWIEQEDSEAVAGIIARLVAERIPGHFGLDPMRDIQVLTPMHRGSCGAQALNERLQEALNPPGSRPEFSFAERRFRCGDRIMQTVNNYDKGVFNGELGMIHQVDYKTKTFQAAFDIGVVDYGWDEADQILHAYAVTVHKSQGSEFPAVVIPVSTQHYVMLQRNLIYTAMTRAKQLLILVGTTRALAIAVKNNRPMLRYSLLARRLGA